MRRVCAALLLVGCFSSDPGDRRFPCDESHGCPPGQVCTNNVCQEPAAQTDAAAPIDAAIGDMTISQCTSGNGYPIGSKGAWACLGTFSPAKPASSLCASKKLCSDISALVSTTECNTAKNVLIGTAGTGGSPSLAKCATATSGPGFLLYGCGLRTTPTVSETAANVCRGFTMIHYPNTDGFKYNTADYSMDAQTNLDPNAGVICCP